MLFIVQYLKDYFRTIAIWRLVITLLLTAALIAANYLWQIEKLIRNLPSRIVSFLLFLMLYLLIYGSAFFVQAFRNKEWKLTNRKSFFLIFLLAPCFFALKMIHWSGGIALQSTAWTKYLTIILQWPLKLLALLLFLRAAKNYGGEESLRAFRKHFPVKPYFLLLLMMVPLILFASTRPDFLQSYPKLQQVYFINNISAYQWPLYILFEICYGSDFISIELFFRGLLVIGIAKYVGKEAILPMAVFYCSIHFGKPLLECISSFAGGLILGILSYGSRSIGGGLMIHLGIAFLMEICGYLGHLFI